MRVFRLNLLPRAHSAALKLLSESDGLSVRRVRVDLSKGFFVNENNEHQDLPKSLDHSIARLTPISLEAV